jgi:hypothetical protein
MKQPRCDSCPIFKECQEKLGTSSAPSCADELTERIKLREAEQRIEAETAQKEREAAFAADEKRVKLVSLLVIAGIAFLLVIIAGGMIGCPTYNVYSQKMQGRAILAHAQSSREVAVAEAKAKMESAVLLAAADTLRAQGVARSNIIIGQSLTESYLRWFWISELKPGGQVIYVPTEANLPILEAAKRKDN